MPDATENAFLGALLGMAIGDALGAPVAGLDRAAIAERFGTIRTYVEPASNGQAEAHPGEFTDETEVALCLVESMTANRGLIDVETAGVRLLHLATGHSRHWMQAATLAALDAADVTLEFRAAIDEDGPATADVASRGVPIGLMHAVGRFRPDQLRDDAEIATRLTHGGPAAFNATTAVAYATRLAATGAPREHWAKDTAEFLGGGALAERLFEVDRRIRDEPLADLLEDLGAGIEATEAIPAAFAAAMHEPLFENAVAAVVNAGGATDTTGALAGALAGAAGGASGIPQELIDALEGRIYVSLAAPWFYKAARQRAGQLIDLRPVYGPRPEFPPRQ